MDVKLNARLGEALLRQKQVREVTGLANSTIYLYMSEGRFPKPIRIGTRAVAWTRSSIESWISERVEASRG